MQPQNLQGGVWWKLILAQDDDYDHDDRCDQQIKF